MNFNHDQAAEYRNKVNSDWFLNKPPGTCLLKVFDGIEKRTGPFWYYEVLAEVHVRMDGWQKRFQDKGLRQLDGTEVITDSQGVSRTVPKYTTITEEFTDENGEVKKVEVTEPVALDGEGKRLIEGAEPVYLTKTTKKSKNFALLGIT
jgi:hypothetical protein